MRAGIEATIDVDALAAEDEGEDDALATRLFELANASHVRFAAASGPDLIIRQDATIPSTGGCVWETALCMTVWARAHLAPMAAAAAEKGAPLRVLELGAGCGLLSLALARMRFDVVATEQDGVLENLEFNVERNNAALEAATTAKRGRPKRAKRVAGSCTTARLAWGDAADLAGLSGAPAAPGFDFVVGTDVVYIPELVAPLLRTLWAAASSERRTVVYLCLQQRCAASHALLLQTAGAYFESVSLVPLVADARDAAADGGDVGRADVALLRKFASDLECMLLKLTRRRPSVLAAAHPSALD
jgi:predicted nicotinamide N-methyase